MVAPRILIPWLFAVYILMVTGMSDVRGNPRRWMTLMPARQLWHPVSAMAGRMSVLVRDVRVKPRFL